MTDKKDKSRFPSGMTNKEAGMTNKEAGMTNKMG
jgi:hypothetical protein